MRVAIDDRSESIGRKIRDAAIGRYPYMLVVGDREQEAGAVAVRSHDDGDLGEMGLAEFAARVAAETGARLNVAACQPAIWPLYSGQLDCRHAKSPPPLSAPCRFPDRSSS